jgi:hypothetical protein
MRLIVLILSLFISVLFQPFAETTTIQNAPQNKDEESQQADPSLDTEYAQLQGVDKVTGRFQVINAKVGEVTQYQRLKIKVSICRKSAPFEPPESKAFMTIWEYPTEELPKKLFSGWMFASSPALSTLVNHARYNIWLIKCTHNMKEK